MQQLHEKTATPETVKLLTVAGREVTRLEHAVQAPVHVILALLAKPEANPAARLLHKNRPSLEDARQLVKPMYQHHVGTPVVILFTDYLKHSIGRSQTLAAAEGSQLVRTGILLEAIIDQQDPNVEKLFGGIGIDQWAVKVALQQQAHLDY